MDISSRIILLRLLQHMSFCEIGMMFFRKFFNLPEIKLNKRIKKVTEVGVDGIVPRMLLFSH